MKIQLNVSGLPRSGTSMMMKMLEAAEDNLVEALDASLYQIPKNPASPNTMEVARVNWTQDSDILFELPDK